MELFRNRVTYECLAAFNFDSSMRKPQKSKALEKCNMSPTANCPREYVEAVVQSCSVKKVFLEISQNSQENTCARVSFLIKLQASGL